MRKINTLCFSFFVLQLTLLSLVSCRGDDEFSREEEQALEAATKFWSVVGQLVSMDDCTDDYLNKTFEPTIGTASEDAPLTRVVSTNSMAVAAQRFANLTGADIDENTPEYTYSDPDVGTLVYHKSTNGRSWATVDVSIKQVPHLEKIIYQSAEQGNTNGAFDGKAYYRFGDVISRQMGQETEYWICVRPAFGIENKEDSHWACLNSLPPIHVATTKMGTHQYYLPKLLGPDTENRQNFVEMLYAICNPQEWEDNISKYASGKNGLSFFTDFKSENLQYHNHLFWQNVQKGWESNDIVKLALNLDNIAMLRSSINSDGMSLIYQGRAFGRSAYEFNVVTYTNGTNGNQKNLHGINAIVGWKESIGSQKNLDFRVMGGAVTNYNEFFKDKKYRWVIRHYSGTELSSTKRAPVDAPLSGCKTVYRYYDQYPSEWTNGSSPEVTK